MRLTESITKLQEIAANLDVPLEKAAALVIGLEKMQKEEHDLNCTTPEDREKMKAYGLQNNGALRNLSSADICLNAGVEPNKVNKNYASSLRARLLTHKPE